MDVSAKDDDYIPNLFDLAGSTIPLTNEPAGEPAVFRWQLPQNIIDAALTLGANDPDSRLRIIAEFMKDKPLEENVRFLQAHYEENGAGFYVGERKYSLWYNDAGMQIAAGESALTFTATAVTWEQAAERIRGLLDEGRYASQAMLYRAWPYERNRVAKALQYLHRDIDDEYKDKYLPTLTAALGGTFIYPDVVDKTKDWTALFLCSAEKFWSRNEMKKLLLPPSASPQKGVTILNSENKSTAARAPPLAAFFFAIIS